MRSWGRTGRTRSSPAGERRKPVVGQGREVDARRNRPPYRPHLVQHLTAADVDGAIGGEEVVAGPVTPVDLAQRDAYSLNKPDMASRRQASLML